MHKWTSEAQAMFDKVMNWLEDGIGSDAPEDVQVAVAALYYHMIVVDGKLLKSEVDKFTELLRTRYNLDEDQLEALSVKGIEASGKSSALFPLTVILKRDLDPEQHRKILEALQQLADADGVRHELETRMIKDVSELLDT